MSILSAPFPYFGGKAAIAKMVWQALGQDVRHYVEPFFGSGAVLLARENCQLEYDIETVCDKDGFLCNVWRSLKFSPDETAEWCDWPVNHADLMARKKALLKNESLLLEKLVKNDEWHDTKMAGYWIWAASCWIGSGLTRPGQRPHFGTTGMGVHKQSARGGIHDWFAALSNRLRYVRVVCGDWTRICGGNWQDKMGICGMFFDPPYGVTDRDTKIYHHDSTSIAADVMEYVRKRADNPRYRIVLAGYEEYAQLLSEGWTEYRWSTGGGYGNIGKSRGAENRHRERLYFSPHCAKAEVEGGLFS